METEKTLWQTIKSSFQGLSNEGSAKRMTSFYIVVLPLTGLLAVYIWAYRFAVSSTSPTNIQTMVVSDYKEILWTLVILILTLLGFATLELITSLLKKVTGQNLNEKGTDPDRK